jgi:hypothetical protein
MKCEFTLHHLLKMEPTQCSETSAFNTQTPGKYPEDNQSYKSDFSVLGSAHRDARIVMRGSRCDYESNQQDAIIQVNLLFLVSSTCFER